MQQLLGEGLRAWRLLRDPRTPTALKLIPAFGLVYVLFPVDLVPDLVPGAGQLDDVAVLLLALRVFLQLAGQQSRSGDTPGDATGRATWFDGSAQTSTGSIRGPSRGPDVVTTTYRVRKE
jgi:uncharacterized membrane protein YkvA (DUF1232 family)